MGFLMVTFVSFFVYALEGQNSKNEYTIDNLFNGVYWGVVSSFIHSLIYPFIINQLRYLITELRYLYIISCILAKNR